MKPGTKFNFLLNILDKVIFIPTEKTFLLTLKTSVYLQKSVKVRYERDIDFKKLFTVFLVTYFYFLFVMWREFIRTKETYPRVSLFFLIMFLLSLLVSFLLIKVLITELKLLERFKPESDKQISYLDKKNKELDLILKPKLKEYKINLKRKKYTNKVLKGFKFLIKIQNQNKSNDDINLFASYLTDSLFSNTNMLKYSINKIKIEDLNFSHHIIMEYMFFLFKNKYLDIELETKIAQNLLKHFPIKYNRGFSEKNIYRYISDIKEKQLTFKGKTSEIKLKSIMTN